MANSSETNRFEVLDGWRAVSITLVLAGHLLPIGPSRFKMNEAIAATGMALFFTLSGFLITKTLIADRNLFKFIARRLARILPLAWLAMLILFIWNDSSTKVILANLLFYANLTPDALIPNGGGHLWSLCVEMQIYLLLAALVFIMPKYGLFLVPVLSIAVTFIRIKHNAYIDISTVYRCDEILAGGILALIFYKKNELATQRRFGIILPSSLLALLIISSHPASNWLQYFRPYISACLVASTIWISSKEFNKFSNLRIIKYLANTSYALYIIHGMLVATWLNDGSGIVKYAKRPIFFAITFFLSHISTYMYEKKFTQYVRRYTSNM